MLRHIGRFPLVIGFLLPLAICQAANAEDLAKLIETAERSVVRINVRTTDGGGVGSGFVLAEGTIATNFHVVDEALTAEVEFSDGTKIKAAGFLAVDPSRDVAILATEKLGRAPLPLATVLPHKGEHVVAIGAPKGLSFTSSDGIVSAIRTNAELEELMESRLGAADMTWIQTTAPISPGNSGGPLINMSGEVVGINTMMRLGGQNLNFAVSSIDIKRVFDRKQSSQPFAHLPKGRRPDKAQKPGQQGPKVPTETPDFVVTLPSGRVLDIDLIFLSQLRDSPHIFSTGNNQGRTVVKSTYQSGKVASTITELGGKLDGPSLATYETGEPSTFANYSDGNLQGNLLTWNSQGHRTLFAQFIKGKPSGLVCLFKDDALWLAQEVTNGKVASSHVFKESQLVKSYTPTDPADEALTRATEELDKTMRALRTEEAKVKKSLREMDTDRRKKYARASRAEQNRAFVQQEAKTAAANNAAIEAGLQRQVRAMLPR